MPTPGSRPQVNERVRWRSMTWQLDQNSSWHYGRVVRRSEGTTWGIRVLEDGFTEPRWLLTAGYMMDQGALEIIVEKPKMDQDAFEYDEDHVSFVVTIRRRDDSDFDGMKKDMGRIRRAAIEAAEDHGIDIKLSGRRNGSAASG